MGGALLPLAALVVAALALALSAVALVRSGGTTTVTPPQAAGESSPGGQTGETVNTPSATGGDAPTTAVTTTDTGSDGPLPTPTGSYTVAYDNIPLVLRPNSDCNADRIVDLDQPLINATTGQDMSYDLDCRYASVALGFSTTQVAVVTSPTATAADCVRAMQLSPASQGLVLSQDLVVCTLTDGQGAPGAPQRRKVVRMVVSSIDKGQTTHLSVTAWEVPH
jgi:hypothetical protein